MQVLKRGRFWAAAGCIGLVFFGLLVGLVVAVLGYREIENLVEVITVIRSDYIEEVSPAQLVEGAAKGIVESLDDPYSVYLEPGTFNQLRAEIRGSFGGLGILVGLKDNHLTVVRPFPDTPAGRAGIKAGDVIVKIDDRYTEGLDLETAVSLMRGPVGTEVTLLIMRAGSKPRKLTLSREEINVPSVEGKLLPEKIGHIAISQFTERTPAELHRVIAGLQAEGMRAIILDLRDNPGGELQAAVKVADYFVPEGPVVYVDYRRERDEVYRADGHRITMPLVVLVNENSASAAEIVAAAVKETKAGKVLGTRTFGKGVVQSVFPLKNGAGLKLTTAYYLTPKKHYINKKGVEPDIRVEQPKNGDGDQQLAAAREVLLRDFGLVAARGQKIASAGRN
uniref:S41 family peptidase n=1 Tax=Ammonifex degensii TaxID=42838 RepID=A0A7C2EBT5_9THEO